MEKQCASVVKLDTDIESKYFETVPYYSDDPDITWYKTTANSDEEKSSSQELESPASDQETPIPMKKQNHETSRNKLDHCDGFVKFSAANSSLAPSQEPENGNVKISQWDHLPFFNEDLETPNRRKKEESFTKIIRRRRELNLVNKLKTENADYVKYPTNIYPNNWKSVTTPPGASSNFPVPSYSSSSVPRSNIRNAPSVTRRSFPPTLICRPVCNSPASKRKSSNYEGFESPYKRFKKNLMKTSVEVPELMPCYKDHQLLGDSQLVRFSEQLLGCKQFITYTEDTHSRRLGYCVSGQKIKGLEERILKKELKLSDKFILLIGTNDMVYGTDFDSMCQSYDRILLALKETAKRIVIVTVPPVPKLDHDKYHMPKLLRFNEFLESRADGKKVFMVDLASLFISYSDTVSTQFYEQTYQRRRSHSRVDLIHLNRSGFNMLRAILNVEYFDKFPL